MNLPVALCERVIAAKKPYRLLASAIPDHVHRDRGGCNWGSHAVDWLGNGRARDKYVDLFFVGQLLSLCLHFGRLRLRRRHYIFTRISECRCAKRQRD